MKFELLAAGGNKPGMIKTLVEFDHKTSDEGNRHEPVLRAPEGHRMVKENAKVVKART